MNLLQKSKTGGKVMKAEIKIGGVLWIVAENPCEAIALKYIFRGKCCPHCGVIKADPDCIIDSSAISVDNNKDSLINDNNTKECFR